MRRLMTMAVLALCAGLGACSGPKEQEFGTTDAQAVRQATTDLEAAFNANQIDKILALYADNSVFMPPNKPLLRGREPLKSFFDGLHQVGWKELKLTPNDVAGHGPLAYESGSYTMMNGQTPDRGKFLIVFRNLGGNWKIEYTSWSSDLPPASVSTD
jgi:ketosteroid isomerase-like protein